MLCCGVRGVKGGEFEWVFFFGWRIDGKREGMNFFWWRWRGGVMFWLLVVVFIKEFVGEISGVGLLLFFYLLLLRFSWEWRF